MTRSTLSEVLSDATPDGSDPVGAEVRTYSVKKRNAVVVYRDDATNVVVDVDGTAAHGKGKFSGQELMLEEMREADGPFEVVLTHPHEDHAVAGAALSEDPEIDVSAVNVAAGRDGQPLRETDDGDVSLSRYSDVADSVRDSIDELATGRETKGLDAGRAIVNTDDEQFVALWPPNEHQRRTDGVQAPADASASDETNDASVVAKYTVGDDTSVLFTGDIESGTERQLTELYDDGELDADVLVFPHHGARNSGSRELLRAVDPDEIVFEPTRLRFRTDSDRFPLPRRPPAPPVGDS